MGSVGGPSQPEVPGIRLRPLPTLTVIAVLLALGAGAWVVRVWTSSDDAVQRESMPRLDDRGSEREAPRLAGVLDVLVVGSDSREGLSEGQRARLRAGDFEGERTDTILLVRAGNQQVSAISFPRDLAVEVEGHGTMRINSVLARAGRDALVGAVEDLVGIELDHYVEVGIPAFVEVVDAVNGVEVCLEEPLQDPKSGADFDAGCQDMDGVEALAFVRSRLGDRADIRRIERQQQFLLALADRATSMGVLTNPVRLQELASSIAEGLTVDDDLELSRMVGLARDGRRAVTDGLETFTLPTYSSTLDGVAYVEAYRPALEDLRQRLEGGEGLPPSVSADVRSDTRVMVWGTGAEAGRIEGVLFLAGWDPGVAGSRAQEAPTRNLVHVLDGPDEVGRAVAALVGGEVAPFPDGVDPPQDVDVVVVARRVQAGD